MNKKIKNESMRIAGKKVNAEKVIDVEYPYTGEIIGTLGSDDVFKPKIFQKIIYYFENKSVFWIVWRNEIINQNNQIVRSIITNFKNLNN